MLCSVFVSIKWVSLSAAQGRFHTVELVNYKKSQIFLLVPGNEIWLKLKRFLLSLWLCFFSCIGSMAYGFLTIILLCLDLCVWGELSVPRVSTGKLAAAQVHREGAEHIVYIGGEDVCSKAWPSYQEKATGHTRYVLL